MYSLTMVIHGIWRLLSRCFFEPSHSHLGVTVDLVFGNYGPVVAVFLLRIGTSITLGAGTQELHYPSRVLSQRNNIGDTV